jgi:hypothetical protein
MAQDKDIGFVQEGDAAEIKIDTFNFKYGLLHGKVLSVSADSIVRERPAGQTNNDKAANISGARSSEPQGPELVHAARVSLDETRMQIERKLVLAARHGGDGRDRNGAAADHRVPALPATPIQARESARAVTMRPPLVQHRSMLTLSALEKGDFRRAPWQVGVEGEVRAVDCPVGVFSGTGQRE